MEIWRMRLKGQYTQKWKFCSINHSHVIPNMFDFVSYVVHKKKNVK